MCVTITYLKILSFSICPFVQWLALAFSFNPSVSLCCIFLLYSNFYFSFLCWIFYFSNLIYILSDTLCHFFRSFIECVWHSFLFLFWNDLPWYTLWVRISVEYSILSFADHVPVSISIPADVVVTSRWNIFLVLGFLVCIIHYYHLTF